MTSYYSEEVYRPNLGPLPDVRPDGVTGATLYVLPAIITPGDTLNFSLAGIFGNIDQAEVWALGTNDPNGPPEQGWQRYAVKQAPPQTWTGSFLTGAYAGYAYIYVIAVLKRQGYEVATGNPHAMGGFSQQLIVRIATQPTGGSGGGSVQPSSNTGLLVGLAAAAGLAALVITAE